MTKHRVAYAPKAEAQIEALYDYLAAESSPDIAEQYVAAIIDKCESLADFPRRGTPRDDLHPGLRTLVFRRRVIIAYLVEPGLVTVLEVLGAGRDVDALRQDN